MAIGHRYVTTYLTSTEYHKYRVVEEMTDSNDYAPEVCLAVYEALERLQEQESANGEPFDPEYRATVLQESAEYSVGSWYDEDTYKMAMEADVYTRQAIDEEIICLSDRYTTISDMICGALVVLIREMALRQLAGKGLYDDE